LKHRITKAVQALKHTMAMHARMHSNSSVHMGNASNSNNSNTSHHQGCNKLLSQIARLKLKVHTLKLRLKQSDRVSMRAIRRMEHLGSRLKGQLKTENTTLGADVEEWERKLDSEDNKEAKEARLNRHLKKMVRKLEQQVSDGARKRGQEGNSTVALLKKKQAIMKKLMVKALGHQRHKYHKKIAKKVAQKVAAATTQLNKTLTAQLNETLTAQLNKTLTLQLNKTLTAQLKTARTTPVVAVAAATAQVPSQTTGAEDQTQASGISEGVDSTEAGHALKVQIKEGIEARLRAKFGALKQDAKASHLLASKYKAKYEDATKEQAAYKAHLQSKTAAEAETQKEEADAKESKLAAALDASKVQVAALAAQVAKEQARDHKLSKELHREKPDDQQIAVVKPQQETVAQDSPQEHKSHKEKAGKQHDSKKPAQGKLQTALHKAGWKEVPQQEDPAAEDTLDFGTAIWSMSDLV